MRQHIFTAKGTFILLQKVQDNMLYMCDDGNEYPLMDGLENLTVEELQEHINKARLTTINILKEMEIDNG